MPESRSSDGRPEALNFSTERLGEAVPTQVVRDGAVVVPMLQRPDGPLALVALRGLDLPSCEETLLNPSRTY